MSTIKFTNSVLIRYCILDWNFLLEMVFCKNTRRYSENILTGVLENCWRELQGKEEKD